MASARCAITPGLLVGRAADEGGEDDRSVRAEVGPGPRALTGATTGGPTGVHVDEAEPGHGQRTRDPPRRGQSRRVAVEVVDLRALAREEERGERERSRPDERHTTGSSPPAGALGEPGHGIPLQGVELAVVGHEREAPQLGGRVGALGDPAGPRHLELVLALEAERPEVVDDVAHGGVGQHRGRRLGRGVDHQADEAAERAIDRRPGPEVGAARELLVEGAQRHGWTLAVPGIH